jgi:hypothetical protein
VEGVRRSHAGAEEGDLAESKREFKRKLQEYELAPALLRTRRYPSEREKRGKRAIEGSCVAEESLHSFSTLDGESFDLLRAEGCIPAVCRRHFHDMVSRGVSPNDAAALAIKFASGTGERSLLAPQAGVSAGAWDAADGGWGGGGGGAGPPAQRRGRWTCLRSWRTCTR